MWACEKVSFIQFNPNIKKKYIKNSFFQNPKMKWAKSGEFSKFKGG